MSPTQSPKKKEHILKKIGRTVYAIVADSLKFYLKLSVLTTSFSLLLQLAPRLVSTSLQEHMQEQGHDDNIKDAFKAGEISVYKRGNILAPLHMVGRTFVNQFNDNISPAPGYERDPSKALKSSIITTLLSPRLFIEATLSTLGDQFNAFTLASQKTPLEDRHTFIYPPAKSSARSYIKDFAYLSPSAAQTYEIKSDSVKLAEIFYKAVMYHECRHGDQLQMEKIQNECDADVYALRMLKKTETDKQALKEFKNIWIAARSIGGIYGDHEHATALALVNDSNNPIAHLLQGDANRDLSLWLSAARNANADFFAKHPVYFDKTRQQNYYLLSALSSSGKLDDKYAIATAKTYISSYDYFSKRCDGYTHYSPKLFKHVSIDLKQLHLPAYPVRPSAAPSPAAP